MDIRGGATTRISNSQLNAGLSLTMASLIAGSFAGAIGVGVSYPFDTVSTKAQVTMGSNATHSNLCGKIARIFKEEGIAGFFEGVLLTVSLKFCIYFRCMFPF
jgi:hypothetical protein